MMNPQPAPHHEREEVLCLFFDEAPHQLEGRTYVQKLMFVYQQQADENWFVFEAGEYGPFSSGLYTVKDYCIDRDYLTEEMIEDESGVISYHYGTGKAIDDVLGDDGADERREIAREVFEEYPTDDLKDLLDAIYTEYPAWARYSIY